MHNYLAADLEIVWQVISVDFPDLIALLEQALAKD